MTRGVVVCLALLACAPPVQSPRPMTAAEILRETAETYAHAKSYVDHGRQSAVTRSSVVSRFGQTFDTAFVRGGVFRYDGRNDPEGDPISLIWSDGARTISARPGDSGFERNASLGEALVSALGVPGEVVRRIPLLLMPSLGLRNVTELDRATRGRDEIVDGHACWQVTGATSGETITLWIDSQSHLIRQIEARYHLASLSVDAVTRFEPAINGHIDEARLMPPAEEAATAWLGVMFEGHNGTTRVQSVVSGGPAEHAGMQPGDVITKIDTEHVAKAADVIARVRNEKVGAKLHVTISRGGKEVPLDITLEKRPALDELQARLVNHPAPDFALAPLTGGGSAKLADLKGHVVIVDFWATWCGPCAMAMPHLVDLAHKYKDLRVVGISDENASDIKQYIADHKIDYTIARDADDVVTGHYLVTGLPTLVIIDKAGVVRALHIGAGDFDAIEAEVQQYSK